MLNGRYGNSGQANSEPSVVAFTESSYVMKFKDGGFRSFGDKDFNEAVHEIGSELICASLLESDDEDQDLSYILVGEDSCRWRGVPGRMARLLSTRKQYSVTWAQLGCDGGWFLQYDDGAFYCEGLDQALDDVLESDTCSYVDCLLLSQDNPEVWHLVDDEGASWTGSKVSNDLYNEIYIYPTATHNGYYEEASSRRDGHRIWRHNKRGDVIEWWESTGTCKTTLQVHPRDQRRLRGNPHNKDLVRDGIGLNELLEIFENIRAHTGSGRYFKR